MKEMKRNLFAAVGIMFVLTLILGVSHDDSLAKNTMGKIMDNTMDKKPMVTEMKKDAEVSSMEKMKDEAMKKENSDVQMAPPSTSDMKQDMGEKMGEMKDDTNKMMDKKMDGMKEDTKKMMDKNMK